MASNVYIYDRTRVTVAQICGDSYMMDITARQVLRNVKTVAAQHAKTGDYIRNLGIVTVPGERGTGRTVKDRLVVADDPGAAAIEWGHYVIRKVPGGRRVQGHHVPGMHPMGRGLALTKAIG